MKALKKTTLLKLLLLLPLVAPVAAWGTSTFLEVWDRGAVPSPVNFPLGVLVASVYVAGIPYVVFAILAAFFLRGRTARQHWLFAGVAPLLFVPCFALCLRILFLFFFGEDGGVFFLTLFLAPWILGLGYAYVLLAGILHRIARGTGLVRSEGESAEKGRGLPRFSDGRR